MRSINACFYSGDICGSIGFCLHPLVNASTHSSSWWLISPLQQIRERFDGLNHSNQTIILLVLLLFMLVICIALALIGVLYFRGHSFFLKSAAKHENVEYVMLEDLDEYETLTVED
jgi:hypothetical protein